MKTATGFLKGFHSSRLKDEGGFAFIVVLGILFLVTLIAIGSFGTSDADRQISSNNLSSTRAYYAAEAGAIRALSKIADSAAWRAGYNNATIGNSKFSVEIIDSTDSGYAALKDTLIVLSTGNAIGSPNGTESRVEVVLAPRKISRFRYAAFGDTLFYNNGDTKVDAYNSDSGAYFPNGMGGDLGSNDQMYFNGSMNIYGNVGTPDTIIKSGPINIYGTANNSAPPYPLDSIPTSEMNGAIAGSNAPGGLTISGSASYNPGTKALRSTGGTITLSPGTYYFSSIDLESGGKLVVPATGNVVIYTTGVITVEGGSIQNQTAKAAQLQIYSTGPSIYFGANFSLTAAIYAPKAEFKVNGNYDITGSVIAKSMYLNGTGLNGFHFDRALLNVGGPGKGKYKAVAWKVL